MRFAPSPKPLDGLEHVERVFVLISDHNRNLNEKYLASMYSAPLEVRILTNSNGSIALFNYRNREHDLRPVIDIYTPVA